MKNTKMALAGLLLAGSISANAQSVSYKTIYNSPDTYDRTVLYLDLFNADYYLGPTIGSALKLETVIADRIMPSAQLRFAWLDANTSHAVSGYPTNQGGQKKQMSLDLGSAFFLYSKNVTRKVKMVLASHESGNTRSHTYIMMPATVKKMMGFEGGVYINRRAIEMDDDSHKNFRYKSADGLIDAPIRDVGSSATDQPAGEYYKPTTMAHIFNIYAGIHTRKVRNVCISAPGYGVKTNSKISDFYADVMLAPSVKIDNVIDIAGREWILVAQSNAIRHIGWRAGFTHHATEHTCSFAYNFEFGQKPGPILGDALDGGAYLQLGMGMSIGSGKYIGSHKTKPKDDKPADK